MLCALYVLPCQTAVHATFVPPRSVVVGRAVSTQGVLVLIFRRKPLSVASAERVTRVARIAAYDHPVAVRRRGDGEGRVLSVASLTFPVLELDPQRGRFLPWYRVRRYILSRPSQNDDPATLPKPREYSLYNRFGKSSLPSERRMSSNQPPRAAPARSRLVAVNGGISWRGGREVWVGEIDGS